MRRRILILLAAAVLALTSGVGVLGYARSADERALKGQEAVWVLLATETIPAGTSGADIRAGKLYRQVRMPAATVPSGALARLDQNLDGMRLTSALQPDQMLMSGHFANLSATPSPAPTFEIPRNRLAVSVALSIAPQVAGNVDPGDEVAVFATYPRAGSTEETRRRTFALLPRVRVISVGERPATPSPTTVAPTPDPSASPSDDEDEDDDRTRATERLERYVVTLSVTQQEAQMLITTQYTSNLQLALLGPGASVSPEPALKLSPSRATPKVSPSGAAL